MQIDDRTNTVTLSINLDDWHSVSAALEYIRTKNTSHCPSSVIINTNKIKIIKIIRAYGMEVKEGTADAGLKSAKDFVEARMADLVYIKQNF